MKTILYPLLKLLFCVMLLHSCQTKPQEDALPKNDFLNSCDTTYSLNIPIENSSIEILNENNYRVPFSTSTLSNIETLRDSLYSIEDLEFYADSILDINGDGYLDLILESYAGAGFGIKYLHTLYLFNPKTKLYVNAFEHFLNVAFFPERKIFTSTCFGEDLISGKKYQWEGLKFTSIEEVSMENAETCEFQNRLTGDIFSIKNCSECFPKEYFNYLTLD